VRDTYLDVEEFFGQDWRSMIDWVTRSVECSTKHFNTHWHSEYITSELASRMDVIDTGRTFENLNQNSQISLLHISVIHHLLTYTTACFPLISST
jgi:hypothetical protein